MPATKKTKKRVRGVRGAAAKPSRVKRAVKKSSRSASGVPSVAQSCHEDLVVVLLSGILILLFVHLLFSASFFSGWDRFGLGGIFSSFLGADGEGDFDSVHSALPASLPVGVCSGGAGGGVLRGERDLFGAFGYDVSVAGDAVYRIDGEQYRLQGGVYEQIRADGMLDRISLDFVMPVGDRCVAAWLMRRVGGGDVLWYVSVVLEGAAGDFSVGSHGAVPIGVGDIVPAGIYEQDDGFVVSFADRSGAGAMDGGTTEHGVLDLLTLQQQFVSYRAFLEG